MNKTLMIILAVVMMSGVVMAQEAVVADEHYTVQVSQQFSAEELYVQMIPSITAQLKEWVSGYYASDSFRDKLHNRLTQQIPSSLNSFLISNVYEVTASSVNNYVNLPSGITCSPLLYMCKMKMGENQEFLPVFQAIYNHILSLVPSSYMDENAAERFALVQVYVDVITADDCNKRQYEECVSSDFVIFFREKELAMGENGIAARMAHVFNTGMLSFRLECFTILSAFQDDFYGLTMQSGKYVLAL